MRDISLLYPELQTIVEKFLADCKAAGLPVIITETWRSKEEQDALYAKGRTAPGNIVTNVKYPDSMHNWGVAFDFARNVRGKEYDDSDGFFAKVGNIGKKYGLTWGGDWKSFVDKPHLEMTKFNIKDLKAKYGTPDNFKSTWKKANVSEAPKAETPKPEAKSQNKVIQKPEIDIETAINILIENKIITSPDYWLKNYNKLEYLDKLIINMAKRLVSV